MGTSYSKLNIVDKFSWSAKKKQTKIKYNEQKKKKKTENH